VGKSSLLNALAGRRSLARTSRTPGKTRAVNVFTLDDRAYFVDLPGYGYARAPRTVRHALSRLIRAYFQTRKPAGVVWLLDLRRDPSPEDLAMGTLLAQRSLAVLLALTKADKIPRGRRPQRVEAILRALGMTDTAAPVVLTSARTGEGIPALRAAIERLLELETRRPASRTAAPRPARDLP
jgi:GTP-binding protein